MLRLSALTGEGVAAFWAQVEAFRELQQRHGGFEARRRRQAEAWMWDMIHAGLREHFLRDAGVRAELPETKARVLRGELAASTAARALLARFERH